MNENKPISVDGSGFEVVKSAVVSLLNQYPGLGGQIISYMGLDENNGISIEPESGALVYTEKKDITGTVKKICQFPFFVVYRSGASNEYQKFKVSDFLDALGSWLSGEPVIIDENEHTLKEYPTLSGNRKITSIVRFNSYALAPNPNNTQDWVLPVTVNYTHEYESW